MICATLLPIKKIKFGISNQIISFCCGQQKKPAIVISTLLLQTHAPPLYHLVLTWFCWNLESSTTNAWNAKNAIFPCTSRHIWTLDHVKVTHSSCPNESKLSVSTWIQLFCSFCCVVWHYLALFRLNQELQLFVLNFNRRVSELFALDLTSA